MKEIQNVLNELPEKRNMCPCMTMVRLAAESVAEDLEFISRRTIGHESLSNFIHYLYETHNEEETDLAIERLFTILKMLNAKRSTALMESLELQDNCRAHV